MNKKRRIALGLDYGTLSGRAVLVDIADGSELAAEVLSYPHGVMDDEFHGKKLPAGWALQDPADYLEVLRVTVPAAMKKAGVKPEEIVGVGVDFTSCTVLPTKEDGTPLCFLPEYREDPRAYVKLWKDHGALSQAARLEEALAAAYPERLKTYGGKVSPEWLFPKIMETAENAPELYRAADRFIEAGDWIVRMLTGCEARSACQAGYKALWNRREGYLPNSFWAGLVPEMDGIIGTKIPEKVVNAASKIGEVNEKGAELTGLAVGTPVSSVYIDAHAAFPGSGVTRDGTLLLIVGTSTCQILLGEEEKKVPGICGVVDSGIIPGYFGYEAGQAATGDIFDWFVKNCVPASYAKEAEERGIGLHKLLREKAMDKAPGEGGLVALDWWNGNRSPLQDSSLSGLIVGMTLTTKPEDIYRALLEATAFGTKLIIDNFEANGVAIGSIVACGGIAVKDALMMQIYADVTGRSIRIAASDQTMAVGSAVLGAAVSGAYRDIHEAAAAMGRLRETVYEPIPAHTEAYRKLYGIYRTLHERFMDGGIMRQLRDIK